MGWKDRLRNAFSRGHKDIYDTVKEYAQERGVAVTDVVASAMASYLAADEEGKDMLENTMKERRAGGGGTDVTAAVKMFTEMATSMSSMFSAVNELRSSVSIGSIVSDFETVTGAVEKIKGMGQAGGSGSLDDKLADAFIRGLVNKFTGGVGLSGDKSTRKKTKKTGEGEVEEIEQ